MPQGLSKKNIAQGLAVHLSSRFNRACWSSEIKTIVESFLISESCTGRYIEWRFVLEPSYSPPFASGAGGLSRPRLPLPLRPPSLGPALLSSLSAGASDESSNLPRPRPLPRPPLRPCRFKNASVCTTDQPCIRRGCIHCLPEAPYFELENLLVSH